MFTRYLPGHHTHTRTQLLDWTVDRNKKPEDEKLVQRFATAFPAHPVSESVPSEATAATAVNTPAAAAVVGTEHGGHCQRAACCGGDHAHCHHVPCVAQSSTGSSSTAASSLSSSSCSTHETGPKLLPRIVAFGQFTGSLLYGAARKGLRAWSDSLQFLFAQQLLTTHMILMVCEYNTSQVCVFDALYGNHGGDVRKAKMSRLYRKYPDGSTRWERELYCPHCGRIWHRDVHAALAIRVNLLWLLKYGCYHPFYRPPWLRNKEGRVPGADADGKPDFHQTPIPNSNAHG